MNCVGKNSVNNVYSGGIFSENAIMNSMCNEYYWDEK